MPGLGSLCEGIPTEISIKLVWALTKIVWASLGVSGVTLIRSGVLLSQSSNGVVV